MIEQSQIQEIAQRLGIMANASQVILFGSYARGDASDKSDVDLMIVAESDLPRYKRSVDLYKSLRPYPFGLDLVVYTPQEVQAAQESPLSFISTVLREGKELYVRSN